MTWDHEFDELMVDRILWAKKTGSSAYGTDTYGTPVQLKARVVKKPRMVRDASGNEVVSSTTATIAGAPGVEVDDQVLLPGFVEGDDPAPIIAVFTYPDEDGAFYEEVVFG